MFGLLWAISAANYIVIYLLFRNFLNPRPFFEQNYTHHIAVILLMSLLTACINSLHIVLLNTAFFLLATFVFSGLLWRDSWLRRLLLTTSVISLGTLVKAITLLLTAAVLQMSFSNVAKADYLFFPLSIMSQLLLLVIVRIINLCFPQKRISYGLVGNRGTLILVPVLGILTVYLTVSIFYGYPFTPRDTITLTLIGACLMLSSVVSFYVYDSGETKQELKYRLEHIEMNSKIQELYYQQESLDDKRTRALLHDICSQLITIREMASKHDPALSHYIDELVAHIKGAPIHTASVLQSPVLEICIERAKEICRTEGIHFTVQLGQINLSQLSMLDTGIIFNNLLDNAVQACRKLGPGQEKTISFIIRLADNNILIGIKNTKQNQRVAARGGILISSRRGGLHLGQGFENVKHVVEQNNGTIAYQDTGTEFEVNILLPEHSAKWATQLTPYS